MNWILFAFVFSLLVSGCTSPPACNNYSYDHCLSACTVCPPCETCSSLTCQTETFCNEIGFNSTWYQGIISS